MLRSCLFALFVLFLSACKQKGETVTRENLQSVLTQYGKDNPENEVLIETRFGKIRLRLYEETPLHRANFVKLVKEGYYETNKFYRIVNEFMIQGGDVQKKLNYTIPAEFNPRFYHKRGALSMARFDEGNPNMESSATEFFIVQGTRYDSLSLAEEAQYLGLTITPEKRKIYTTEGGYLPLDEKYTVFGEVLEGLDVVDKIAREKVFNVDKPLREIPFEISLVTPGDK